MSVARQSAVAHSINEPDHNSFSLKLSSSTLTLAPTQGGSVIVTLSEGCRSTVTFGAIGFPTAVDYVFQPPTSRTGSTLVVYVPAGTAPGTYPVTITGTSGRTTETVTLSFTVSGPNFGISAPSATLTLPLGTSATAPVTVTPGPGFTGAVTFGLAGLPAGVIYLFSPASSNTGSTLTLYAYSSTQIGSYPVTLSGTYAGQTVSVGGTLVIAADTPNFTVTAPGDTLTLPRGTSASVPITVTPGAGFSGTVTFGISGLPAGVTYVFTPASSTSGSTLVLAASESTAVGSYNVVLSGTSGGATATANGTLIIQ